MPSRIWEDSAAMNVVSVLGFLLNDEAEVVGTDRTKLLCKLMPSIQTATHRALLSMLIANLSDSDTQTFYLERGLKVLHQWLEDALAVKAGRNRQLKERQRTEIQSHVRALLRILDTCVKSEAERKKNAYLMGMFPSLLDFLSNAGSDYSADWSRIKIMYRHFESTNGPQTSAAPSRPSTTSTPSSSYTSPRPASASVLLYQPKSFLSKEVPKDDDDDDEDMEDESIDTSEYITNTSNSTFNATLEKKIQDKGHQMVYGERTPCRNATCKRMSAKQCTYCHVCVKCAQKGNCTPSTAPLEDSSQRMSVRDRNVQVLGSAMDAAIYKAFKEEDFYSVFSLVQNGMDVNFQRVESDKSTALMAAAHHGREDAVDKLLSLKANPCLKDKSGATASVFAERHGHTNVRDRLKRAEREWQENLRE